ncbi:proline-rich receptor-like protein kinase PERK2 [Phaseolus vulgaris]|uniref:proline-rich receptor-like protein kinase PERK2 n=1 Tax=Phaseolus vulgaris TaxID=3885 RepID=UPI0035C9C008
MGELDRDLCLFWKRVAAANITFPTSSIISFEYLEGQLEAHIDFMLGKGKLAELRALARTHKLATGSQTVPNSVVEIAAAQGRSPPQGPTPPETLPAPQRKKLILRKPKRKTPQVVQEDEDEDDEVTEDGLVTKRKRVAPSSPPALPTLTPPSTPAPTPPSPPAPTPPSPPSTASIAEAAPGGDEGAHNSPILITESPTSPPC